MTPKHAQAIRERLMAVEWSISSTGHVSWKLDHCGSTLDLTPDGRAIPRYVVALDTTATGLAECQRLANDLHAIADHLTTIISTAEGLERRVPTTSQETP